MQFSQIFSIISLAAAASAGPVSAYTTGIEKRACWELTGNALKVCQTACTVACAAASLGIASAACSAACTAGNLKERDELLEIAETEASPVQLTSLNVAEDTIDFNVNASAGRTACVIACEVTCNSTVLALMQTKCLNTCKGLCPSS